MEPKNTLKLAVNDKVDGVEVGPAHVPLSLLGDFQQDVADFLRGSTKDVDPNRVIVSIESGSLAIVATGLLAASHLWHDVGSLENSESLALIDAKRARVLIKWQAAAKKNPDRKYRLLDDTGRTVVEVSYQTQFYSTDNVWVSAEKYLLGTVTDMGGNVKPNIHVKVNGQILTVAATQDQLAESEKNRLYREELLHVSADENLVTGELRNMRLIAFQAYKPKFDEAEFDKMVERGTRVWSEVDDNWLEIFRNGGT